MSHDSIYALVIRVLRTVSRLFPTAVRARIRYLLFQWLDLTWSLPTDLRLRVGGYGDWIIYNEIFVSGEYDQALAIALDTASERPLRFVDLGANVGFFTLRVVDQLRRRGLGEEAFTITAVEASASNCRRFEARVFGENGLSPNVTLVPGAVGKRSGMATFLVNQLVEPTNRSAVRVPFVDLAALIGLSARIDLLKCDVEGGELLVLENYPDLFRNARVAVFELHRDLCDTDRCQALLREYGFTHHAVLREGQPHFGYTAWRE